MALNGAKHISYSHENCEKLICFASSKTGAWQRQKKASHHLKQDPGNNKNSFYIQRSNYQTFNPI
jgi:hypothetical protein